jgi:hypothetical protein
MMNDVAAGFLCMKKILLINLPFLVCIHQIKLALTSPIGCGFSHSSDFLPKI